MTDDAELSIGIQDNVTKEMARIAASVRKAGADMGASAADIEKAVARATGSVGKLATSLDLTRAATRNRNALIGMKQDLAKYQAQVEAGTRAQQALARGDNRDARGRIVSNADIQQYLTALKAVENLEKRIAAERRKLNTQGGAMTPALPVGGGTSNATAMANMAKATKDQGQAAVVSATQNAALAKSLQMVVASGEQVWPPAMFKGASQFTQAVMDMNAGVRYAMYDVARNAALAGTAMLALGVGAVFAAARWERSFADVQRTVQGSEQTLERVREGLIGLSQDIPVAFGDLTQIASVGGQMGIAATGIVQYTETIAKLTATTNLTADAAGKALGRFKAFFAEADDPSLAVTDQTFSNLASSILKVGVNSVATESGIVNVATQISSMGTYAGFTADQVIGLSGALSSVGVPPELSRGVITRLFSNIGQAVSENGTRLQDFARLAGVSAQEFSAAWGTDRFAYIFTNMVAGLGEVSRTGGDANQVLTELGITSVRDVPVLLRLANAAGEAGIAGGLLAQTMNDARTGWRENIELQLQYSKISETLSARSKVLLQNLEALFATMGEQSLGPVKDLVNGLIALVKGFTELGKTDQGRILGSWAIQIAVVGGAVLLLVAGLSRIGAAAIGAGQALSAMGVSAAVATPLVRGLGLALSALSVITLAITAAAAIFAIAQSAEAAINPVQNLEGALAAMQSDTTSKDNPFTTFEAGADAAAMSASEAGSQAERMGSLMGYAKDEAYGAGEGLAQVGESARIAALNFGVSSREFLKSSILQSEAFKKLTGESNKAWVDSLTKAGFSMDKLIELYAQKGREAAEAYLEGLNGAKSNKDIWEDIGNSWIWMDQNAAKLARSNGDLLNGVGAGIETFKGVANGVDIAGEALVQFTSATQIAGAEFEDFQVQNEDAINSMADGFKQFVDTSSLIGFTQSFKAASSVMDDVETDLNENAQAALDWESSWRDAYGGASFTLAEYMVVFERAAAEQAAQTQNLQTLIGRGVPTDIITDLAAMGPESASLVRAMVEATQPELDAYVAMYGRTGFDSMVGLAAGQLAAEQIVRNAAKSLTTAQLQQLSADLQAGTPLVDAMAKWQLDANGNPIEAPVFMEGNLGGFLSAQQQYLYWNPLRAPVTYYETNPGLINRSGGGYLDRGVANGGWMGKPYANGGHAGFYTGRGGKWQPAGIVHRGEVITPARDVDQSTGRIKPEALIRMLNGGTPARRGGNSFAEGGHATGSMPNDVMAHLSMEDRSILMLIADRVGITITERTFAAAANSANANSATRRTA